MIAACERPMLSCESRCRPPVAPASMKPQLSGEDGMMLGLPSISLRRGCADASASFLAAETSFSKVSCTRAAFPSAMDALLRAASLASSAAASALLFSFEADFRASLACHVNMHQTSAHMLSAVNTDAAYSRKFSSGDPSRDCLGGAPHQQ